jgi:hypothetical protein
MSATREEATRLQYEGASSEVEETEQAASSPTVVWPNIFAMPVSEIRTFICNSIREMPLEVLTEAPSASEMSRLASEVMHLSVEELSKVLLTPVGPVRAWLDEDSGSHPTPETVSDGAEWHWKQFLALWSIAMVLEQQAVSMEASK